MFQDGKLSLSLQMGDEAFTLSCPVPPGQELSPTLEPQVDISHYGARETEPESPEPPPWAPPFYLAPPYYPHPKYSPPYLPGGRNPSSPAVGLQPPPDTQHVPVRESSEDSDVHGFLSSTDETEDPPQEFADLQKNQGAPGLSPFQGGGPTGTPHLQPPGHAFNSYYHYYHLPKIPLPDPPQNPHPGPEPPEALETKPLNHKVSVLPQRVQEFTNQVSDPVSEAPPFAPHPYPPHFLPNFPFNVMDAAGRWTPLHPNAAAETNLSKVQHHEDPYMEQPGSRNEEPNGPVEVSEEVTSLEPELEDQLNRPSYPPGPSSQNPPPYLYFYPYYHYYGPETLPHAENPVSPTSKQALETHQTTKSPSEPTPTVQSPPLTVSPESAPGSDHSRVHLLAPDEEGYLDIFQPLYLPFSRFSSPHVSQQLLQDPFGGPDRKEGKTNFSLVVLTLNPHKGAEDPINCASEWIPSSLTSSLLRSLRRPRGRRSLWSRVRF